MYLVLWLTFDLGYFKNTPFVQRQFTGCHRVGSLPPQLQTLPSFPLRITDSQRLTLFTHMDLTPILGLFRLPSDTSVVDSGVMVVTANRRDISARNIRTLMTTASPAAVRAGKVNPSMTTQPDIVRPWLIFD
jgi:hypothetical protein